MTGDVLDIRKLIQDPIYRAFLQTAPVLPHTLPDHRPWYYYVRREIAVKGDPDDPTRVTGTRVAWLRAPLDTYQAAYAKLRKDYREAYDAAIVCRVMAVDPPLDERFGKPWNWHRSPELRRYDFSAEYKWCGYCRRPTKFQYFAKHHAFGKQPHINDEKRCHICGIREGVAR